VLVLEVIHEGKVEVEVEVELAPSVVVVSSVIVEETASVVIISVVSVVNVSVLLAAEQHKHPHDAIFLPNGDMVVATWAPGRISYWKLLPVEEEEEVAAM
jgi:hypothetical protein